MNDDVFKLAYELDQVINNHVENKKIQTVEYLYVIATLYTNFSRMMEEGVVDEEQIDGIRNDCMLLLAGLLFNDEFLNNDDSTYQTTH